MPLLGTFKSCAAQLKRPLFIAVRDVLSPLGRCYGRERPESYVWILESPFWCQRDGGLISPPIARLKQKLVEDFPARQSMLADSERRLREKLLLNRLHSNLLRIPENHLAGHLPILSHCAVLTKWSKSRRSLWTNQFIPLLLPPLGIWPSLGLWIAEIYNISCPIGGILGLPM